MQMLCSFFFGHNVIIFIHSMNDLIITFSFLSTMNGSFLIASNIIDSASAVVMASVNIFWYIGISVCPDNRLAPVAALERRFPYNLRCHSRFTLEFDVFLQSVIGN